MANKMLSIIITLFISAVAYSQQGEATGSQKTEAAKADVNTSIPIQAKFSDKFRIVSFYFNKKIDLGGRGEILEYEAIIDSRIDDPLELYIWTIATYEKADNSKSSFEHPVPPSERVRNFIPFPYDMKNFEYPQKDSSGKIIKDEKGNDKIVLIKHPKDPKAGVDPDTGKPYLLKDRLIVRTSHLSRYRNNFTYFNNMTVLIFDKDGNLIFRQLYDIIGKRR